VRWDGDGWVWIVRLFEQSRHGESGEGVRGGDWANMLVSGCFCCRRGGAEGKFRRPKTEGRRNQIRNPKAETRRRAYGGFTNRLTGNPAVSPHGITNHASRALPRSIAPGFGGWVWPSVRVLPAGVMKGFCVAVAEVYVRVQRKRLEVVVQNLLPVAAGDPGGSRKGGVPAPSQLAVKLVDLWRLESRPCRSTTF